MSDNINFDYKNLSPFKWFVLENFPFIEADFDALTEWQLFCKIGKEINKIIDSQNIVGEQAETLTNAFNALKNYVDNYFNNLDVQDEINNKLNEMAENGELINIISQYLNLYTKLTFNNIEEMKKSKEITIGTNIETLGYYEYGDGGGANYSISNTPNSIDYGSSILLENGLYANLIPNNFINIKQFGAKGDNIQDDTQYLQNAIYYMLYNRIEKNKEYYNVLYFPSGIYKVSSTIFVSPYVKIKTLGHVTISSIVKNSSVFRFAPIPNEWKVYAYSGLGDNHLNGNWIDGDFALTIINQLENKNNTIGIEISTLDLALSGSNRKSSRFSMRNVRIEKFDVALKINPQYTYLLKFIDFHFEFCNYGVQLGDYSIELVDSGENIIFERCTFGNLLSAFKYENPYEIHCNNCSFDYITNGIATSYFDNTSSSYIWNCFLEIYGGHMESMQVSLDENSGGLITGNFQASYFKFDSIQFFLSKSQSNEILGKNIGILNTVILENFYILEEGANIDTAFIITNRKKYLINENFDNTKNILQFRRISPNYPVRSVLACNKYNLITNPIFETGDVPSGTPISANIGNYSFSSYSGNTAGFSFSFDNDLPFNFLSNGKTLVMTATKNGTIEDNLHFRNNTKIPVTPGKTYKIGLCAKTNKKIRTYSTEIRGYNAQGESIGNINRYQAGTLNADNLLNEWLFLTSTFITIPSNVYEIDLDWYFLGTFTEGDVIKVTDFIMEEY